MGRTYIPDTPTWVCDVLHGTQDVMTLTVCADTPEQAADAAMSQAITDLGEDHHVKSCNVYSITTSASPAFGKDYNPNIHKPKRQGHNLRVVK